MATVAESLFGVTPESLMASREKRLQEQADAFGRLTPIQAARAGFYEAGSRLGSGIGGLLGAQDPELMRVRQRQEMLQGVDPTSIESLQSAAQQAMARQDFPLAQELANRIQDMQVKQSQVAKNLRETKSLSLGDKAFTALAAKATPESVKKALAADNDIALLDIPKDQKISAYGQVLKDAGLVEGTPEFQVQMKKFADAELESTRKGKGTNIVMPGLDKAGDITSFRKDVQSITKPYQDKIDAADDAISLADNAIKTGNFASAASLARSLAKTSGETQITNRDVSAFGADPSLIGSIADTASRLAQGRPTIDTLTKLRQLAELLKKKNEARLNLEEEQLQATARSSKLYTDEQLNTVFRRRPAQGGVKTSFNSMQEALAAKLPTGTEITINGRRAVVE
jgi:hypothetical protein